MMIRRNRFADEAMQIQTVDLLGELFGRRSKTILAQLIHKFKLLNFTYCPNPDTFRDLHKGTL
jgi:hypothetical protein